ncbi:MAG TPA: MaoC/PaaZ C-terminal domain-containing protein [Falsiroseomonas sp.]|nr:MaoC/PaaZ C-terminal domain-containing protein [Falsiroseomonas sp.]
MFEDVVTGELLPEFEITVTLTTLVTYAAGTWDFHRLHYDPAFAGRAGLRAPAMDGQMAGGLLARQLMLWGGPDAFVRRLAYRLRNMVFQDDRIRLRGEITGTTLEQGRALALCRMQIMKSDGTEVIRDASAAVELQCRSG